MTQGRMRTITGTNPAAGVEISETVPAGVSWVLRSIAFSLTTSATAANRAVRVVLDDGATIFLRTGGNTTQTASQTLDYVAADFGVVGTIGTQTVLVGMPLPPYRLLPGHRVRTITINFQAGDDFTAPVLEVEES